MALTISNNGLAIIKKYEGCKLTAYKCPAGVWTIGYGHTAGVEKGMVITQAKADAYLKADCAKFEKAVNKYYSKYKFNQNQFDALVSFTYNCGAGNLNKLLNYGERSISKISDKITSYNKANGKVLNGLVKRRAEEKALFDKKVAKQKTTKTTTSSSKKVETAKSFNKNYAKNYTTKDKLNLRYGAGKSKSEVLTMPKGARVTCYGYYTKVDGTIWLLVTYSNGSKLYTGFCSKGYLK